MSFNLREHMAKIRQRMHPVQAKLREGFDDAIGSFKMVSQNGWLLIGKIAGAISLAVWNVMLWVTTIPGPMGIITSITAVALEGTGLWCLLVYNRATKEYRRTLYFWTKWLFGFSLVHAVLSIIHFTGFWFPPKAWVDFYAHVLAFAILTVLLVISIIDLSLKHPDGPVNEKIADSQAKARAERADVLAAQSAMYNAAENEYLRAEILEQQVEIEEGLLPVLGRLIEARNKRTEMIAKVKDPADRQEIIRILDKMSAQKAFADIGEAQGQQPQISLATPDQFTEEERKLVAGVTQRQLPPGYINGRSSH